MNRATWGWVLAGSVGVGAGLADPTGAQVLYRALRAATPLAIDGNLIESAWQAAPSCGPFAFPWHTEGEKEQTEAKLVWDETYLYVSFRCEDAHISAHRTARNDSAWVDDCAEVFIAPNLATPRDYTNYEINCLGTYVVGVRKGGERLSFWEPPGLMIGRSHRGTINHHQDRDAWWILELAIPFANFERFGFSTPPAPGTVLRLNLHRLGGEVNPQSSLWHAAMTERRSFHTPERFAEVELTGQVVR